MSRITMTFDNINSDDIGFYINHYDVLKPQTRENTMTAPGIDGEIDFDNNGDETYESRIVRIECALINQSAEDVTRQRFEMAGLLSKKAVFSFSDLPNKYYIGRCYDAADLSDEDCNKSFTLNFKCEPFIYGDKISESISGSNIISLPIDYPGTRKACTTIIITNTSSEAVEGFSLTHVYEKEKVNARFNF